MSDNKRKKLLALLGIVVLAGVGWFGMRSRDATYREQGEWHDRAETTRQEKKMPARGAIVIPAAGYPRVCMDTEDGLGEILLWMGKDNHEAALVLAKHGGVILGASDELKLLGTDWGGNARVRVMATDRECYVVRQLLMR